MSQEKQVFSIDLAGRQLTVETGQLAKQANGAVLVRYGDTAVLSTATASKEAVDFFPLTVNYEERLYAVGKFLAVLLSVKVVQVKSNFGKSFNRPSTVRYSQMVSVTKCKLSAL